MHKRNVLKTIPSIFFIYSSIVLILNNLNISTIKIGANTSPTTSNIFPRDNTGILKISLKNGTNKIMVMIYNKDGVTETAKVKCTKEK